MAWEKRAAPTFSLGPQMVEQSLVGLGLVIFLITTLCFSFRPCWDGNFCHSRQEHGRGQADKGHKGLLEEIQLSHQHVGRLRSAGNLLHEVQLRLGRSSHSQGIPQKQNPQRVSLTPLEGWESCRGLTLLRSMALVSGVTPFLASAVVGEG